MENDKKHDEANQKELNIVGLMMSFEDGTISDDGFIKLFEHLIKTGMAWTLQGFYGRTAKAVIEKGFIDNEGNVDWDLVESL